MIQEAKFISSVDNVNKCPKQKLNEFAFIGRSNVGKSSLINMLTNQKKLAKISGKPGKTQTINHFLIDNTWFLVDLPGYGYAKTSKTAKEKFQKIITSYIAERENLTLLFVLIDSRLEPQKNDIDFITWLGINEIPFSIIFTKSDKLSRVELDKSLARYRKELKKLWEELPKIITTSSTKHTGREELIDYINFINSSVNNE